MNKKIITAVSTFLSITLSASSVFAAALTKKSAKLTADSKGITVYGKTDADTDEIVVKIMDVGSSDTTVNGKIKGVTVIDMYGKNEFTETLSFENELSSGRYLVYLSGTGLTGNGEPIEVWYQTETDKANLMKIIYDSVDENAHYKALFEKKDVYGDGKTYDNATLLGLQNSFYKSTYDSTISQMLFPLKTMDYTTLKNNFTIANAAAAFNTGEFGSWTNSDGTLKEDIWSKTDINMSNVQKHYNETLSSTGRSNVITALSGKGFTSLADFNKAFAQAVMYNGVYNAKSELSGYGHISQLISDTSAATGYDFSAYNALTSSNKASVDSRLLQTPTADFNGMTTVISQLISGLNTPNNEYYGGGSGGGGGSYNAITNGQTVTETPATDISADVFSDLSSAEWAREAIENLKSKNIVSGTGDGTFEPQRTVKREEFIKMLVSALEIPVSEGRACFDDVDAYAWYAPYITAAYAQNIAGGFEDGTFGVGMPISRQECCAFIYRAAQNMLTYGEETKFADIDDVAEWALESVKALSSAGIIVGDENGNFNPHDYVTRAQAAVMIYKLISGGNI